jgi:LacI family transcriptional regulator
LKLGHRRIAFLAGACPEREEGYKAALTHAGLNKDSCIVVENCIDCNCGKTAFQKLRTDSSMPTAVISYSDNVAAGFIAAAIEAGVKVPEEISVVGIDNLPVAEMLAPALTTISQPKTEQGSTATDLLLKMINGEKLSRENSVVFEPSLVIRKSCKEL